MDVGGSSPSSPIRKPLRGNDLQQRFADTISGVFLTRFLTRFRPPNRPPSDRPCCPLAVSLAGFSRFNFVTVANLELEKQINFGLSTWSRHGGKRGSPRKDPIPPWGGGVLICHGRPSMVASALAGSTMKRKTPNQALLGAARFGALARIAEGVAN